jgi:hypothetical protein
VGKAASQRITDAAIQNHGTGIGCRTSAAGDEQLRPLVHIQSATLEMLQSQISPSQQLKLL